MLRNEVHQSVSIECGMISAYAWNASPIDGTDIIRSVPAIGRELKFPLDINLVKLPTVIDNASESVATYLRSIGNNVSFARDLLAWLLDDKRANHRERANERRRLVSYKEGDVVMVRTVIHSNKAKGIVKKLVYQSRGPYTIVSASSKGTYNCKKYGKPNGVIKSSVQKICTFYPRRSTLLNHLIQLIYGILTVTLHLYITLSLNHLISKHITPNGSIIPRLRHLKNSCYLMRHQSLLLIILLLQFLRHRQLRLQHLYLCQPQPQSRCQLTLNNIFCHRHHHQMHLRRYPLNYLLLISLCMMTMRH